MSRILVFDLGTTYFKACLFDEAGTLIGLQRVATPVEQATNGRAEIAVSSFRQTLLKATRDLAITAGGLEEVVAVSFASQTNSFLVLDQENRPLSSIILWSDQRAKGMDPPLRDLAPAARFYETTGVPNITHEFLPAKVQWIRKFQPAVFEKIARVMLLSDYLTWWMTGSHCTEAGVAGLTGLVDIHRLEWSTEAYEEVGIRREWLPEIVRAGTEVGTLQPAVATQFGLPRSCRFIVGCLDQYAGAIGAGNVRPEGVSETTGSVLATVRCSRLFESSMPDTVFQGPSFTSDQYYQMMFGDVSAGLLERYRNSLPDQPSFEVLDDLATRAPPSTGGVVLHPGASRKEVEDLFCQLGNQHSRGHAVRAIYEVVAGALREQVDTLCRQQRPKVVVSVGGAARSKLWLQIKREHLGCEVRSVACPEPTSLGAARLAMSTLSATPLKTLSQSWGGLPRESS